LNDDRDHRRWVSLALALTAIGLDPATLTWGEVTGRRVLAGKPARPCSFTVNQDLPYSGRACRPIQPLRRAKAPGSSPMHLHLRAVLRCYRHPAQV
jgi:hypothetical protein